MIYDSRTDTVRLHHKDKVYLAGALGVLKALKRCEPDDEYGAVAEGVYDDLRSITERLGVVGDEHLKRPDKADAPEPMKHELLKK